MRFKKKVHKFLLLKGNQNSQGIVINIQKSSTLKQGNDTHYKIKNITSKPSKSIKILTIKLTLKNMKKNYSKKAPWKRDDKTSTEKKPRAILKLTGREKKTRHCIEKKDFSRPISQWLISIQTMRYFHVLSLFNSPFFSFQLQVFDANKDGRLQLSEMAKYVVKVFFFQFGHLRTFISSAIDMFEPFISRETISEE